MLIRILFFLPFVTFFNQNVKIHIILNVTKVGRNNYVFVKFKYHFFRVYTAIDQFISLN